jgi:TATA-binding protein-associated factor
MTSRLDRLVLLLDTGSTNTVRSAAAKQLGQVQKQHPDELYPLLTRVLVHLNRLFDNLYSKSWETRIAAGQAIEAICSNVPIWDPAVGNADVEELNGLLSFDNLDINNVLMNGKPLLSSKGKEFDDDLSDMDPKERLALQKKRIIEKLGLGTQFMDSKHCLNLVDFFDENDVKVTPVEVKKEKVETPVEEE